MRRVGGVVCCLLTVFSSSFSSSSLSYLSRNSPVTKHNLFGRQVFVKRDDLLNFHGLSGNKARKFYHLASLEQFPKHLISFGGIQSNSMLALAQLVQSKKESTNDESIRFTYFTKAIPKFLKMSPSGNYDIALKCGMQVIEIDSFQYNELIEGHFGLVLKRLGMTPEESHFVPMGGACMDAAVGLSQLAEEIYDFAKEKGGRWRVLVASGTGTTALFLNHSLHKKYASSSDFKVDVQAIPCVGSAVYLLSQMQLLASVVMEESGVHYPGILEIPNDQSYVFAKPYKEHLEIWNTLRRSSGIKFDLVYAPRAWQLLLQSEPDIWREANDTVGVDDCGLNLLYYHCGGLVGTDSQLARYSYKKVT